MDNIKNVISSIFDASTYNYWLEVCALLFLVVIAIKFFISKKFPTRLNIFFAIVLIVGLLDLFLDILGSVLIDHINSTIRPWVFIVNSLFYLVQVLIPAFMCMYVLCLADIKIMENKRLLTYFLPAIAFVILVIVNFPTKILFYIDSDFSYKHGTYFVLIYIMAIVYLALTGILALEHKKKIGKENTMIIFIFIAIVVVFMVLQIIFPTMLLTGVAIAISIYLVMDHMSNPRDMVDKKTGLYNYDAYELYIMKNTFIRKNKYYIVVKCESLDFLDNRDGFNIRTRLCKEVGSYIKDNFGKLSWTFRIHGTRFVLVFNRAYDQKRALKLINERFKNVWKLSDESYKLDTLIFYFNDTYQKPHTQTFIDFVSTLDKEVDSITASNPIYISEEMLKKEIEYNAIFKALQKALNEKTNELSMNYQPIYNTTVKQFTKAEALIRFNSATLGNIRPDVFIPIAEANGLADKIDEFALISACKVLKENKNIKEISINVSCTDFFENPCKKYLDITDEYEIDPSRISFEITETAAIKYPEKIHDFMKKMIENKFKFYLDDYGTGYSNLAQIIDKPFACIKIDKELLSEEEKVQKVLESSVRLFHEINLPVTIEGVETEEQLKRVKDELKVNYVQGYYFSKPLPEKEFIAFMNANNKHIE